jgi:serine O-acetyltransferase
MILKLLDPRSRRGSLEISALGLHRIAHRLWRWNVPLLPRLIDKLNNVLFAASVPHNAKIGEGTMLTHRGMGVIMHFHQEIGKGVVINPFVLIGSKIAPLQPRIEDDVFIGAHAVVLGDITIGRGAIIGAGAIVIEDVPPGGVVVGPSARLVRINPEGGKEYLARRGSPLFPTR